MGELGSSCKKLRGLKVELDKERMEEGREGGKGWNRLTTVLADGKARRKEGQRKEKNPVGVRTQR